MESFYNGEGMIWSGASEIARNLTLFFRRLRPDVLIMEKVLPLAYFRRHLPPPHGSRISFFK